MQTVETIGSAWSHCSYFKNPKNYLINKCMFFKSINTLCPYILCYSYCACSYDKYFIQHMHLMILPFMTHISSYMFWHQGVILKKHHNKGTNQHPNLGSDPSYRNN